MCACVCVCQSVSQTVYRSICVYTCLNARALETHACPHTKNDVRPTNASLPALPVRNGHHSFPVYTVDLHTHTHTHSFRLGAHHSRHFARQPPCKTPPGGLAPRGEWVGLGRRDAHKDARAWGEMARCPAHSTALCARCGQINILCWSDGNVIELA